MFDDQNTETDGDYSIVGDPYKIFLEFFALHIMFYLENLPVHRFPKKLADTESFMGKKVLATQTGPSPNSSAGKEGLGFKNTSILKGVLKDKSMVLDKDDVSWDKYTLQILLHTEYEKLERFNF